MADKKVFEAASITSLDFDRTEVDFNNGSGGITPGDGGGSTGFSNDTCYAEFCDLDTGSYTVVRVTLTLHGNPSCKNVTIRFSIGPGLHSNTLAKIYEFSYGNFVSWPKGPEVTFVGNTITINGIIEAINDNGTAQVSFKTEWKHASCGSATTKANGNEFYGGYDGYSNLDPDSVLRKLGSTENGSITVTRT